MDFRLKNILIISPTPWDVSSPARQHYARELAKMSNKVFYLNPPTKIDSVIEMSENLWIVDYKPLMSLFGLFPAPSDAKLLDKINRLIGKKLDVVWSFDSSRFTDLSVLGTEPVKIYSLEEWHQDFEKDRLIAQSADLVLGLSQPLLDRIGSVKSWKYLFDHALGSVFADAIHRVKQIKENTQFATGRIRCGYLGNLQNKYLDTAVFETIIRNNPIVEFHIIGPFVKESNLAAGNKTWEDPFVEFLMSMPNVRLYGSLMTVRTAEILQTMDMFLVCYDSKNYGDMTANPQKVVEYFSAGNVVVSNHLKSFDKHKDLILMAAENKDLPQIFKDTVTNLEIHNRAELFRKRLDFALSHTYEKQLNKIAGILSNMGK